MALPNQEVIMKYLIVLRQSILHARVLAWEKKSHEEIADLLDAIHNVPEMLTQWESCDEKFLTQQIESYDKKWAKKEGFSIIKAVEFYFRNEQYIKKNLNDSKDIQDK